MNPAAAIAIASSALAVYAGLVAFRFAKAPGWHQQRWFGLIAFGSAAYALGNVGTSLGWDDPVVVTLSRLQLASALFQAWAWLHYADAYTGRHPGRAERLAVMLLLAFGALALIPGLAYDGRVVGHRVAGLSSSFRDSVPTAAGQLLYVAGLGAGGLVAARLLGAWRRGVANAGLNLAGFCGLLLFGANDAAVASGFYPGMYLLDVGFVVPVGVMAFSMTQRFVEDARALHALRGRLEALVEARTGELAEAHEALLQSEKLAALGQFAAGVAHEVNNPASVVTSSLSYLDRELVDGPPPADARQAVQEASAAMQRINLLVRRLVDAGRLAAVPVASGSCSIRNVIHQALDEARARSGDRIAFRVEGVADLRAGLRPEVLGQVVSALLKNATEAIPEGRAGTVELRAQATEDGRVQLEVEDDGSGMSPEVLRRAFEPFFSTRGEGQGSGLGLPVARALVESLGGELRLASRPGLGTIATLALPEAPRSS